jgi:hypothetical protein
MNLANLILSFCAGVIFGVFGSSSLFYFLSFLIIELAVMIYYKKWDVQYRVSIILLSIFGYIIARALVAGPLFIDFQN